MLESKIKREFYCNIKYAKKIYERFRKRVEKVAQITYNI